MIILQIIDYLYIYSNYSEDDDTSDDTRENHVTLSPFPQILLFAESSGWPWVTEPSSSSVCLA